MSVNRKFLFLYLVLIIMLGCSSARLTETEESPIKIFFSPQVNLNHKLAEYIDSAQESIKACFYAINSEEVAYALIRAHLRGVKVQVVMDKGRLFEENSFYPKLKNFGLVKQDTITKGLMHNKFCIIDEKIVWTGSYNPNPYAVYENNDAVAVESGELANIYIKEFEKLWGGKIASSGEKLSHCIQIEDNVTVEIYFSPEDAVVILEKILKLLKEAKHSIYFAQFTITHPKIAEILLKKAKEGINVSGVMEYEQIGPYSKYPWFELEGMDVRKDKNYSFAFHHKFFIIDEKIVVTGSLNSTIAGLNKNRENVIIIHSSETATEYLEYFRDML